MFYSLELLNNWIDIKIAKKYRLMRWVPFLLSVLMHNFFNLPLESCCQWERHWRIRSKNLIRENHWWLEWWTWKKDQMNFSDNLTKSPLWSCHKIFTYKPLSLVLLGSTCVKQSIWQPVTKVVLSKVTWNNVFLTWLFISPILCLPFPFTLEHWFATFGCWRPIKLNKTRFGDPFSTITLQEFRFWRPKCRSHPLVEKHRFKVTPLTYFIQFCFLNLLPQQWTFFNGKGYTTLSSKVS